RAQVPGAFRPGPPDRDGARFGIPADRQPRVNPAWASTLAVAVAAGGAGLPWGWRGGGAGVALALVFHTVQIAALLRWLRRPARDALPSGRGLWEEAFATLHRHLKDRDEERERLGAGVAAV